MGLQELNFHISTALNVLTKLQRETAINIANVSTEYGKIKHARFSDVMGEIELRGHRGEPLSEGHIASAVDDVSTSYKATKMHMPNEVIQSKRIAGKYGLIIELYNRQLSLYKLSISGRS